ncbi:hypothetical protein E2C01_075001 [Portunus trituberculatus]|uniref:Uncharacterized protein n=1 Tax=Portunus trituberculatus TaxID=210409 RepID=A0A5B7I9K2_PORTR|nr:hypothetical protein [Portunus trituberculatus]
MLCCWMRKPKQIESTELRQPKQAPHYLCGPYQPNSRSTLHSSSHFTLSSLISSCLPTHPFLPANHSCVDPIVTVISRARLIAIHLTPLT